jgi:hypothetical protein
MSFGAMPPSMFAPVAIAKVTSASFPSLAKLGDRYSKRFGSLSLRAV